MADFFLSNLKSTLDMHHSSRANTSTAPAHERLTFFIRSNSSSDFLPQRGADYPKPDREGGVCRAGL